MNKRQLIPSIEKRISTWIDLQKKRQIQDQNQVETHKSITISREFGCEAYPLAAALKGTLEKKTDHEWTIFDDEMVETILADDSIAVHLSKNLGERAKYLDYIISTLLPYWQSEERAYRPIVETIFSVAQQGNAIIVGRGAFAITRHLSNCYNFRLVAPLDFRVKSYAKRHGMDQTEAETFVKDEENRRNRFLADFLNYDFNPYDFHIVFNNNKLDIQTIGETIVTAIGY